MIQVQSRKILTTCPFNEYLEMPGYSYSGIKNEGKPYTPATPKMLLGTKVDDYLTSPENYKYDYIEIVKPLAVAVKNKIGALYQHLQPQLVVSCVFSYGGFSMLYKGRGDLVIPGRIVIDLKVSEMPLNKSVPFFGYDHQQNGYALGFDAKIALLMSIHPKTKAISIYNVPLREEFWQEQILKKGYII